jgi:enoyl-CoA hydratase
MTVASDDAYFQMPLPQRFGLPGAQTMLELWVLMNFKRAAEYLFLAPTVSAGQALEWGIVNRVVPRDQLEDTVEQMAKTVAQMPLTTIMVTKAGIKRAWELMGLRSHFQQSADLVALCTQATDVRNSWPGWQARAGVRGTTPRLSPMPSPKT